MVINFDNVALYQELAKTNDDTTNPPEMLNTKRTWENIKRTHKSYDATAILKQDLLYRGGNEFLKNAELFCPRYGWETQDAAYDDRLISASYTPLLGKHMDYFAALLFDTPLSISEAIDEETKETYGKKLDKTALDAYNRFMAKCDKQRMVSLSHFMCQQFIGALNHQTVWTGVDFPARPKGMENVTRDIEEKMGFNDPYLYTVDPMSIVDWRMNDDNPREFEWVRLVDSLDWQPNPLDPPMKIYRNIMWTIKNGFAHCEIDFSPVVADKADLKEKDEWQVVTDVQTTYKKIPLRCLHLHSGIALGAKIGPMCAEHFQRKTIVNYSAYRDAVTVPTAMLGSAMIGGTLNIAAIDPNRAQHPRAQVDENGIYQIGKDDDFKIVEAEGKALAFIQHQNKELEDAIAAACCQMAKSSSHSSGAKAGGGMGVTASGVSKQEDRHEMEVMLEAFAQALRDHIRDIYEFIADVRKEEVVWDIQGLCTRDYNDRGQLMMEALALPQIQIPSKTFHQAFQYKIALALLDDASDNDKIAIRDEIGEADMATPPEQAEQDKDDENELAHKALDTKKKQSSNKKS